jgi:putative ABC transport system ATP-binding protein
MQAMASAASTAIELSDVTKRFGDLVALEGVSLAVDAGETVAIVGPSGSGKSTFLNLVSGLDEPTSGEVRFDGKAIVGRDAWADIRATRIGIIFQSFCLIPTLSAAENVEVAMMTGWGRANHRRERALQLLARVGLAERAALRPPELSGGERQRVAIARALCNQPGILIADEPTGSLDRGNSLAIMEMLRELHRDTGTTLLIVTHDPSVANYCDRLVEIIDGHVVRDGPQDENEARRATVAIVKSPG